MHLFSRIRLSLDKDIASLVEFAQTTVGKYVKHLELNLLQSLRRDIEVDDRLISLFVSKLPNLREIILFYRCEQGVYFPSLIEAFATLTNVEHLKMLEVPPHPFLDTNAENQVLPFADDLVRKLLESSGPSLLSLVVQSQSVMSLETFEVLRSKAKRLRTLMLQEFLGVACRRALSEDAPWACRETLRNLSFLDCRGAHAGAIVSGVGNGLWCTNLETLEVCKSGDHDDIPLLPYPVQFSIPPIRKAHYEHAFPWEMDLLSTLQVQEVVLSFIPVPLTVDLVGRAFPKMERLAVYRPKDRTVNDNALIELCMKRNIEFSRNADPRVGCSCAYGQV